MSAPVEIKFTVPGTPVAKGRPRSRIVRPSNGKSFVSHYTPQKTESEEGAIRMFANTAMAGRPLMEGALEFSMCAYVPIPDSWPLKRKCAALAGDIFPTGKSDWDNYGKLVSDSLNQCVYKDDSQIVTATVHKRYSAKPRIVVSIKQKTPERV
jgi:Holliday junction resolvase RusA-like endonuclease